MWDELRRVVRMMRESFPEVASGRVRSHSGWAADLHLRKGFFCAIPVFLLRIIPVFIFAGPP